MNKRLLVLAAALLLVSACGQPGGGAPTALPPGTRIAQPTPDFSAPQEEVMVSPTVDLAEMIRRQLVQERASPLETPTATARPPQTLAAPLASLSVFSRPTALGILPVASPLYTAANGNPIATLPVGTTLTISGRSADQAWFAVYLADGTAGWVPVSQVRVFGDTEALEIVQESVGPALVATLVAEASNPPAPIGTAVTRPTAEPPTTSNRAFVSVLVEAVNVRAGPSTDFPIVGGLFQEEQVALLARNQNSDWVQVELPAGIIGWIFAQLVEPSQPIVELPIVNE